MDRFFETLPYVIGIWIVWNINLHRSHDCQADAISAQPSSLTHWLTDQTFFIIPFNYSISSGTIRK